MHQRCVRPTLRCEALHHEALTWLLLLTGVTYEESSSKWKARGTSCGERYHVGRYDTEEEAVAALRAEQERRKARIPRGRAQRLSGTRAQAPLAPVSYD